MLTDASIDAGILSVLPPAAAIVLALLTKEVVLSLLIGILLGALCYSGGSLFGMLDTAFGMMAQKIGGNAEILLFLGILGALVAVVTNAGGAQAYGRWAAGKIKSRTGAQLATAALGSLIFIDDYFNCLTVGTVMRPVTDVRGIPREKLAYLIDATAAPVCILAPVSTWAAAVASQLADAGISSGMGLFLQAIPFNIYAWLTLVMVAVMCIGNRDFGPMAHAEAVYIPDNTPCTGSVHPRGRILDLLLPIAALIVFTVAAMLRYGGYGSTAQSVATAIGAANAPKALAAGGFCALALSFLLFIPRRLLTVRSFFESVGSGISAMMGAVVILILAWTLSGICADLLGTGIFVGRILKDGHIPFSLLPAAVFLLGGGLSFSIGTSWGTFGILLPIAVQICLDSNQQQLLVAVVAATLAGAVFGDHCSPLSDTTILSSAGAGCKHLAHVSTQLPYALLAGGCSLAGYLLLAFGVWPGLAVAAAGLLLGAILAGLAAYQKKTAVSP